MVRKTKMSKSFCKALIFMCIVAILYSLVRSFLFPIQEGLDNKGLNDFVTGAGSATPQKDNSQDKEACKKPEGWCIHESAKPTYKECGGKKGWWCEDGVNNKGFVSCDHKPGEAWPYFGPDGKC